MCIREQLWREDQTVNNLEYVSLKYAYFFGSKHRCKRRDPRPELQGSSREMGNQQRRMKIKPVELIFWELCASRMRLFLLAAAHG